MIDAEDNPELAIAYQVMQAPTLVVIEDSEPKVIRNVSNIKSFAEELLARA